MTAPDRVRLNDPQQMLAAPSDAYSAGAWCECANAPADALDEAEKALREIVALDEEGFATAHAYERRVLAIAREALARIGGESGE